jgi:hypothetical protein
MWVEESVTKLNLGKFDLWLPLSAETSIHSKVQVEQYVSHLDMILDNTLERWFELACAEHA